MLVALPALLAILAFQQEQATEPEPPALVIVPRLTYFSPDVRGRVRADEGIGAGVILDGSSITFDSDLDLDDSDPVWIFEIAAFHRGSDQYLERASISYLDASFEGASTFDSSEDFNGRTFSAGTEVDSKVRYRAWGADFSVVDGDSIFEDTTGAILLGLRYTDLRVQLEGGGQDSDERLRLFWLGVGFRGERNWGGWLSGLLQGAFYFSLGGFDDWFDLEFQEWGGVMFEGMVGVNGRISALVVEAGWRLLSQSSYSEIDSSDKFEDNDFTFQLGGPYVSATLRF